MCIICVKEKGIKMPEENIIRTMFEENPDGAGIMYQENKKVFIKKGFMEIEPLLEYLKTRDWTDLPVVLHFRIGTAGPNNELNCHPYPVGMANFTEGECELGMVHNGILYDYDPPKDSDINDTQVFLHEIVEKLPKNWLKNSAIKTLIEHETKGSRLTFLDKNGSITKFGKFEKYEGCYYSNESYLPRARNYACMSTWNDSFDDMFGLNESKFLNSNRNYSISFDSAFCVDDEGQAFLQAWTKKEFNEYVEELENKCQQVDDNIYVANTDVYYEVDPSDLAIYRY